MIFKCIWTVASIAVLAAFFTLPSVCHGGGEDLKQLFLTQAPKGWEKMRSLLSQVEGSGSQSTKFLKFADNKVAAFREYSYSWHFKVNQGLLLFERTKLDEGKEKTKILVGGSNSKYNFSLDQGATPSTWKLAGVNYEKDRFDRQHPHWTAWGKGFLRFLERPWTVGGLAFPQMIKESGFKLKNVSKVSRDAKDFVKAEFDYSPPPDHKPSIVPGKKVVRLTPHDMAPRSGWILCDPEHCWAIVEYELPHPPYGKETAVVQYADGRGGIPVPRRVLVRELDAKGQGETAEFVFEDFLFRDIPETEFTLSAYNLPEPVGVQWPQRSRWWLWLTLAAFVVVALPILFRRWKRRYETQVPEPVKP